MHPNKVDRAKLDKLTDLPNVGPSIAGDLQLLKIQVPHDLIGRDPIEVFVSLCKKTGVRHDPCVLDTFISIIDFMDGGKPKPWWDFTKKRRLVWAEVEDQLASL